MVSSLVEQKFKCMTWSSNKKSLQGREVCLYMTFSSHLCVWLCKCVDTQYCLFWFCGLAHIHTMHMHRYVHMHKLEFPFSFSFFNKHTICRHAPLMHTHEHTPILAMHHGGLPYCLSNQRIGSFQLHWSEHIIPFPSSPLLNTKTHKSMIHTCICACKNTHTQSTYSLTRRASAPHCKSKRLMWLLRPNEIVCHYKALHYRTPWVTELT